MVMVYIYGITEMNIEVYKFIYYIIILYYIILYYIILYYTILLIGQFKNGLRHGKGKWIKWIENNKLMD